MIMKLIRNEFIRWYYFMKKIEGSTNDNNVPRKKNKYDKLY